MMMISKAPIGRFPWLGDACQQHFPGDYPAVYPYKIDHDRASILCHYACWCGQRWTCWWNPDAVDWPVRS